MTQKKAKVTKLTKKLAEDIVEMLIEGKTASEIFDSVNVHFITFYSWIIDSIFGKAEDRTPETEIIRERILEVLLAESIILQALKILSEQQITYKETELMALTTQERKALERKGYDAFIEDCEHAEVILKIERTLEPPPISLLEKLMKMVEDSNVDVAELKQQIMPFNPVSPKLPDVVLFWGILSPFFSLLF